MRKKYTKLTRRSVRVTAAFLAAAVLSTAVWFPALGRMETGGELAGYTVCFVDEKDSSVWIFAPQTGEAEEGTILTIPFPEKIIGADGYAWSAVEESPKKVEIFAPGNEKVCITYRKGEKIVKPKKQEAEKKQKLKNWLQKAWEADCLITGNDSSGEPEYSLTVENREENDRRLTNLVTMVRNLREEASEWHFVYLIGKGYVPQTVILSNWPDVEYSQLKEDVFTLEDISFTIIRIGLRKKRNSQECFHQWKKKSEHLQTCLKFGTRSYTCSLCDAQEEVLLPPPQHADKDGDSLCDSCKERTFTQKKGDVISAVLRTGEEELPMSFTCMDEDYRGTGRMMYLAQQVLPKEITGICFAQGEKNSYETSSLRSYFALGFTNEISLAPALCTQVQKDGKEDSVFLLTEEEYERYRKDGVYTPVSEPYFLATPEGEDKIRIACPDGEIQSTLAEGYTEAGVRPFILLETPDAETEPERHYWKEGEIQVRRAGEKEHFFRCIDEDYKDAQDNHRKTALFLCDEVIGADELPGAAFGENNNYKNSNVRQWLASETDSDYLKPALIGVTAAYAGSTPEGMKEEMNTDNLRSYAIGFQIMQDRMFCLSVEEAMRYWDKLWKFRGSEEDNEKSQVTPYSTGYYLRTPVYRTDGGVFCYSEEIYCVDLENGNICPVKTDSAETGIRPVFAMEQGD